MYRTSNAFSVLQAIAATLTLAIILWAVGFPSFRFAGAANITSFSNTLSTSGPDIVANHTLYFITPSGIGEDAVITITFPTDVGEFDLSAIGPEDVALLDGGTGLYMDPGDWTVTTTGSTVVLTSNGNFPITAGASTTVFIGLNAGGDGQTPDGQIVNPETAGSYQITLDIDNSANALPDDKGATEVAIVDEVIVTASVDTQFTFTVSGVGQGVMVNGTSTTGSSTATAIAFGMLEPGVASTAAQRLEVITNANNGFVVTVIADGQLESANEAVIEGFRNGNYNDTALPWVSPAATLGSEETYGHWGLTSDDATLGDDFVTDLYDVTGSGQSYVSASTTPVEVFRHDGPANGAIAGSGYANVAYTVEISPLQSAATDYKATLTYVATPVF